MSKPNPENTPIAIPKYIANVAAMALKTIWIAWRKMNADVLGQLYTPMKYQSCSHVPPPPPPPSPVNEYMIEIFLESITYQYTHSASIFNQVLR
jgi:hypothetical protein